MTLKDLKPAHSLLKPYMGEHLIYNVLHNLYVLVNTDEKVNKGYYSELCFPGISDRHEMSSMVIEFTFTNRRNNSYVLNLQDFILIDFENLNDRDKKFCNDIIEDIKEHIKGNKSHRGYFLNF